jgi:CheY-like chemotaxis protein
MRELSLGRSQFFREQKHILDALSDRLWEAWRRAHDGVCPATESSNSRAALFSSTVEQLASQSTWEPIDPIQLWTELEPLVATLARAEQVAIVFAFSDPAPEYIETDRVLLRQAVLDVLANVLPVASHGGRVEVRYFVAEDESAGLQIDAAPAQIAPVTEEVNLDAARRLMAAMGGALRVVRQESRYWQIRLAWPAGRPILLVIDDNEEFTDLYRRYLAGRNWHVIGAASGREAWRDWLQCPTVILLDVLMPSEDGWELLVALKAREETRTIPVIVCSVLDQPGLALAWAPWGISPNRVAQRELVRALAPWRRTIPAR